jgi:sec-independent protein translocase protein TatA
MGFDSPSHWVIIALVALVLFGYKKLPEMSRSVGRSLRIFKTEIKGMGQDDAARDSAEIVQPGTEQQPAVAPPTVTPPVVTSPAVTPPVVTPPVVTPPPAAPVTSAVTPASEESPQQRTQA